MEQKSKREVLRDKVVDLVKMFVNTEGGISQSDLYLLFGPYPSPNAQEVAAALAREPIKLGAV